ncbi:hypothetical protein Nepgr_011202 [Nepenthes gracilis]|uniref:Uncharacterized protein n=1 Tax=Nepenthes gracilis TaxID=150966 RepID=A0AAD3XM60_NEPGR|nr:hypothetical protein Nepgr_011202 [Nepenthes gracilis]
MDLCDCELTLHCVSGWAVHGSSSGSKGSSATACSAMPFVKETSEESAMDFDLDFTFHLGNEKSSSPKKSSAGANLKPLVPQSMVDMDLCFQLGLQNLKLMVSIKVPLPLKMA